MKLLYICGTYAPGAYAGSELSAHELLCELDKVPSINVRVCTDRRYTGGVSGVTKADNILIHGIAHPTRRAEISAVIDTYKPDVILTQLLWSDVAVQIAKTKNIPSVLRIPSYAPNLDVVTPTALVANSRYICDWVKNRSGRTCHYITSTINLNRVIAPVDTREPQYITMFNPVKHKGGRIFYHIAKLMPDKTFAYVPGWNSLRKEDGSWDKETIKNSCISVNADDVDWLPVDVEFSDLNNVTKLEQTPYVAKVYAKTQILLVPSQNRETLARVSIEALANGIPVIGSKIGGLQDHLSRAGITISDYTNPNAWVEKIRTLENPHEYEKYSKLALKFISEEFSNEHTTQQFLSLFQDIAKSRLDRV